MHGYGRIVNLLLDTDSYKLGHFLQYPKGTQQVFSYLEARKSYNSMDKTLFFGLQYILKEYLTTPITMEEVSEAYDFACVHGLPFNFDGWRYIVEELGGKLPIEIKAVKEGTQVPVRNVLLTVTNTDDNCAWLVGYLETMLLRVWYPTMVASRSRKLRDDIYEFCKITCDNPEEDIMFKVHDFGSRGCSCREQALVGGMAHLTSFYGSDTVVGIDAMNRYYNNGDMSAFSLPATEHSTIISWGKENESKAYKNMLDTHKDYPLIACVSDSYDIFNACENIWGDELKQHVEERNGKVVIRPDSGDPVDTPVKCVELLDKKFGSTINKQCFKVLNNVKVIQGDNVSEEAIYEIFNQLIDLGYSVENINFGMGGGLLVKGMDRDAFGFSFKSSAVKINDEWKNICKTPIGSEFKKSKSGRLILVKNNKYYETIKEEDNINNLPNELQTVYLNGELTQEISLNNIRY